jgi:hypothetical protein
MSHASSASMKVVQKVGAAGAGAAKESSSVKPVMNATDTTTERKLALDECGLHTKWEGDEYCINPPPPDQGFQLHVGPSDYDNPDSKYVMEPGTEVVENISVVSGNETDVYYYWRQYRMRPGSHHLIIYAGGGAGGGIAGFGGRRLGGAQNPAKDNPDYGIIAPENQGVGMPLAAKTPLTLNLHYMNYTDKPLIKETWINFWYRDAKDVTEPALETFSFAPMNVQPGQHVLIHGSCPISQAGRALTLYGHRHANNKRFSIWHVRGGQNDLVFEDYDWEHPAVLEYNSVEVNAPPDPVNHIAGGSSGILDLMPGDSLDFECDVVNMTTRTFVGQNEALDDEMCIMVGDTAEAQVPGRCTYTTSMVQ